MPYPNEHAARFVNPDKRKFRDYRRDNNKFGQGIDVIFGILRNPKPDGAKTEIQAIRFDASKFTAAQARKWLKDNGYKPISFEPATKKEKSHDIDDNYIYKSFPFEVESVEDSAEDNDYVTIKGYAAVFHTPDAVGDIIHPNAFDKSLEKFKSENIPIPVTFQHRPDSFIGKISPDKFKLDDVGLYVEAQLLKGYDEADKASILAKEGVINGFSLSGLLMDSKQLNNENRLLTEINLDDFSFVHKPAHKDARGAVVKSENASYDLSFDNIDEDDQKVIASLINKYYNDDNDFSSCNLKKDLDSISNISTKEEVEDELNNYGIVFEKFDTRKVCEKKLRQVGFSQKAASAMVSIYRQGNLESNDFTKQLYETYSEISSCSKSISDTAQWINFIYKWSYKNEYGNKIKHC